MQRLKSIIESLLFVSDKPLPLRTIRELVDAGGSPDEDPVVTPAGDDPGVVPEAPAEVAEAEPAEVAAPEPVEVAGPESVEVAAPEPAEVVPVAQRRDLVLGALESLKVDYADRGIRLVEVAGGWQFQSSPENAGWVGRSLAVKPVRLSRAALETLAIVAYRQPITRPEIEDIRGVDSGGIMKILLERKLVRILGKKEEVGRPILYGTSKDFLEFFQLRDLRDLPTLREFHELSEESQAKVDALGEPPAEAAPSPPAPEPIREPTAIGEHSAVASHAAADDEAADDAVDDPVAAPTVHDLAAAADAVLDPDSTPESESAA